MIINKVQGDIIDSLLTLKTFSRALSLRPKHHFLNISKEDRKTGQGKDREVRCVAREKLHIHRATDTSQAADWQRSSRRDWQRLRAFESRFQKGDGVVSVSGGQLGFSN